MSDQHGTIHWNELNTRDPKGAISYYSKMCGWEFDTMPMPDGGDYHVAKKGDAMIAGIFDIAAMPELAKVPPHWFMYIAVEDVDAAAKETAAGGGKVIREPWDVPGVGRIAILQDPTGAAVGWMTPSEG